MRVEREAAADHSPRISMFICKQHTPNKKNVKKPTHTHHTHIRIHEHRTMYRIHSPKCAGAFGFSIKSNAYLKSLSEHSSGKRKRDEWTGRKKKRKTLVKYLWWSYFQRLQQTAAAATASLKCPLWICIQSVWQHSIAVELISVARVNAHYSHVWENSQMVFLFIISITAHSIHTAYSIHTSYHMQTFSTTVY